MLWLRVPSEAPRSPAGLEEASFSRPLSCHRFRSNEVRIWLSVIAYNLGNLWSRLVLPMRIENWSLTSLQQRLRREMATARLAVLTATLACALNILSPPNELSAPHS
jgi:hypothetical protein